MGEITLKILNYAGFTGLILGILANLNNVLAVFLGVGSLMFIVFKGLKERENWLYRKAERKQKELENIRDQDDFIRNVFK